MSKETPPSAQPPTDNEPIVRPVKPAGRSKRPPLFQEFLSNFKGGTALEQALAEQEQRESQAEAANTINQPPNQETVSISSPDPDVIGRSGYQPTDQLVDQSTGQPVEQSPNNKQPGNSGPDLSVEQAISLPDNQATGRPVAQAISRLLNQNLDQQPGGRLVVQSTGLPVDQSTSGSRSTANNEIIIDAERGVADSGDRSSGLPVYQPTSRLVDQTTDLPTSEDTSDRSAKPSKHQVKRNNKRSEIDATLESDNAEHIYPSRIGKIKIGVWLPEQQVEKMKLWCLMHKTSMQEIIEQAVDDWWEEQPSTMALPVEAALKTMPSAKQTQKRREGK